MERTLSAVKPYGIAANLTGEVPRKFREDGTGVAVLEITEMGVEPLSDGSCSSENFDSSAARALAGERPFFRRLRRGLLPALLCLPLLAGLVTGAAAQTPEEERIFPPATFKVTEGDGSFSITLTGKPDQDGRQIYVDVASGSGTCADGDDWVAPTGTDAGENAITVNTSSTNHVFSGFSVCDNSTDEPDRQEQIIWRVVGSHPAFRSTALQSQCATSRACKTELTIRDNDPTVVSLARVGPGAVTEGGGQGRVQGDAGPGAGGGRDHRRAAFNRRHGSHHGRLEPCGKVG